jgi:hypothetical protein
MVQNKWKLIKCERSLTQKVADRLSMLKPVAARATLLDILDLHIPSSVWELLVNVVNAKLVEGLTEESATDPRRRDTNFLEFKKCYAIQMLLESTYGNDSRTMTGHFQTIKQKYGAVHGLGQDRFQRIMTCLSPSAAQLRELCRLLEASAKQQIVSATIITIDESVIAYAPSAAVKARFAQTDPIPVVFIPRKPHPNGLECFMACTRVQNPNEAGGTSPFMMAMTPHVTVAPSSNYEIARNIVNSWPRELGNPHWFVDAGFGSEGLVAEAAQSGGNMTASMSAQRLKFLWKALSYSLPTGHWRAAVNVNGLVASVHCGSEDGKRVYQHVLSSNWEYTPAAADEPEPDQPQPAAAVAAPPAPSDVIPKYLETDLKTKSVVELKQICSRWNLRAAALKQSLIDNILSQVNLVHAAFSEEQRMRKALTDIKFTGDGPLHIAYKANFNLVDLMDRHWNSVEEHHHHNNWKTKYTLYILRFAVFNAMVHARFSFGQDWKQFRFEVAKSLLAL